MLPVTHWHVFTLYQGARGKLQRGKPAAPWGAMLILVGHAGIAEAVVLRLVHTSQGSQQSWTFWQLSATFISKILLLADYQLPPSVTYY